MSDYDMSIHTNPDARAWSEFYIKTRDEFEAKNPGVRYDDEEMMFGWFANAIERGRVAHPDTKRERATLAERDRRIAELEAGLGTADSWLMLHARHVGSCLGKSLCTCGLTLARAETGALLSGQQDTGGAHG